MLQSDWPPGALRTPERAILDTPRILMIADGVVRAQNRKIIFTTNLPNIGSIDDALLRPGRCFATMHMRSLVRRRPTPC